MADEYVDPGIKYGYPQCCRDFFMSPAHLGNREHMQKFITTPFFGTGYVPCHECLKKDPAALVKEINSNRDPTLPAFMSNQLSFEETMRQRWIEGNAMLQGLNK